MTVSDIRTTSQTSALNLKMTNVSTVQYMLLKLLTLAKLHTEELRLPLYSSTQAALQLLKLSILQKCKYKKSKYCTVHFLCGVQFLYRQLNAD